MQSELQALALGETESCRDVSNIYCEAKNSQAGMKPTYWPDATGRIALPAFSLL